MRVIGEWNSGRGTRKELEVSAKKLREQVRREKEIYDRAASITDSAHDKPGLASYFVVAALIAIVGLFGWISERDYEYQQEIAGLRHTLKQTYAALDAECGPVIELSMPVDLGSIQL